MTKLTEKKCVACQGGVPPLDIPKQKKLLSQLDDGWEIIKSHHLSRTFSYDSFPKAIQHVVRLADLAEQEGHHPNIHIDYSKVQLDIWTHKVDGLTENDFILAAKANQIMK